MPSFSRSATTCPFLTSIRTTGDTPSQCHCNGTLEGYFHSPCKKTNHVCILFNVLFLSCQIEFLQFSFLCGKPMQYSCTYNQPPLCHFEADTISNPGPSGTHEESKLFPLLVYFKINISVYIYTTLRASTWKVPKSGSPGLGQPPAALHSEPLSHW